MPLLPERPAVTGERRDGASLDALILPFAGAGMSLLLLWALGHERLGGFVLDLGRSLHEPTPGLGRYLALWSVFGGVAAACLAVGVARLLRHRRLEERWAAAWLAASDRRWIAYGTLIALLVPALLRTWLLHGTRLTDDESAYRLAAQLLAAGRLYGDSPPLKLFFDNRFLINDGKLYTHYFLGWPALLAPGVWLRIPGFMNAVYAALTVPPLYLTLRRLAGAAWARAGVVLYLVSPMLMVAAATETAHTSCVAALAWLTWCALRAAEPGASWRFHSGTALAFSVAFFIRPTSALGVGLPFLALWAWSLRRRGGTELGRALAAFFLPALCGAAAFLLVNRAQTGSAFEVAYQRAYSYAEENDFRFALWPHPVAGGSFTELTVGGPGRALAVTAAALFRLQAALFGWPSSLVFAAFAAWRPGRVLWAAVGSYFLLHLFTDNVGADTFAPMHYFEVAWPLLVLTALGLARLTAAAGRLELATGGSERWPWRSLPAAGAVALVAVTLLGYVPVRFAAIHRIAANVRMPQEAVVAADLHRAVVFAPDPFVVYCRSAPTRGWVFARPNNRPDLDDDVLWVNHLSVADDRRLLQHFPGRRGWVMVWDVHCQVRLLPLDALRPGSIPDAAVRGLDPADR